MVKIVSRRCLGRQPVYDIGVARDHNFLLASGLVASNCFNKSHSTAYAYVTYQTAYLKANYPVEYMAALLTDCSGSKDKVRNYIATCQKMGIEVEPPDINRSDVDFTPSGDRILFGLSAVPNVGQGAIDTILRARAEAGGHFESFADFCTCVDLRHVNRRALETLIECGCFDRLHPNRNQLLQALEVTLAWAQSRAKEREQGQMNLFDQTEGDEAATATARFDAAPSLPDVPDLSAQEKLNREKELLGFYISEHPLDNLAAAKVLQPIPTSELANAPKRQLISAIAMLIGLKQITTKKGDPMAFLQLEDLSGQVEGVVFPKVYERIAELLQVDTRLVVWGKVEVRDDDKSQLIVEDVEPVESPRLVVVRLTPEQAADRDAQQTLQTLLSQQAGKPSQTRVPVLAAIESGPQRRFVRLDSQYWVSDPEAAIAALARADYVATMPRLAAPARS
ncbi:MAG: trans-splicing intein-formed DNA polymerase III subunit alpha C-terminal partner DnaE-C [Spirulinaceae cyanobacterium SM2_1_0]|nr:trans-splicing intein-formed DNA polymerase III subunit alpha C-terminal partner DnaE-C [Spirulinaceae cyanobacterium SM2_1_0]